MHFPGKNVEHWNGSSFVRAMNCCFFWSFVTVIEESLDFGLSDKRHNLRASLIGSGES